MARDTDNKMIEDMTALAKYGDKPIKIVLPAEEEEDDEDLGIPKKWEPPDPTSPEAIHAADWLTNVILNAKREIQRIKDGYQPRLTRVESRLKKLEWKFRPFLEAFTKFQIQHTGTKSVLLETGILGFRKSGDKVEIEDADLLAEWALENNNAPGMIGYEIRSTSPEGAASLLGLASENEEEKEEEEEEKAEQYPAGLKVTVTIPSGEKKLLLDVIGDAEGGIEIRPIPDKKLLEAFILKRGKIPPGVRFVAEKDEFYCKEHTTSGRGNKAKS